MTFALRALCAAALAVLTPFTTATATATATSSAGPNIAVYIIGEPRTLNYTIGSMVRNVLEPLRQARGNVTIFIQTYRCPTLTQYGLLRQATNLTVVMTTLKTFPYIDVECAKRVKPHLHTLNMAMPLLDYVRELLGRYYNRWQCDLRRREYEVAHAVRFEWIIWLRPDVVYVDSLPVGIAFQKDAVTLPGWHVWGGTNDRFAVVPRKLASQYFSMFPFLCAFNPAHMVAPYPLGNPERLQKWYLDVQDLPIHSISTFRFLRLRKAVFRLRSNATCPFTPLDLNEFSSLLPQAYNEVCAAAAAAPRGRWDRQACLATLDRVCAPRPNQ